MNLELDRLRNVFLVMLPAALLLVGGGGWLVAGRALRPLKRIRQIGRGRHGPRSGPAHPGVE